MNWMDEKLFLAAWRQLTLLPEIRRKQIIDLFKQPGDFTFMKVIEFKNHLQVLRTNKLRLY